jgi:predicted transcriptional regulator
VHDVPMLGWIQSDLAESAGLSLAWVTNIEREAVDIRASTRRSWKLPQAALA